MLLEDLGPTFMKLGQMLSTRADVLPSTYQAQLALLQDAAPPEPAGTAERVIEREFGRPLHDVFASFDPQPIAAASIGQAHAAVLLDGTPVIVKVRRPNAASMVEVDLTVLERAASLASRLIPVVRRLDVQGLVSEFARTLRAELDYMVEASNAERIAANFAGSPLVHIPTVYRRASTRRVITLERIVGIKVSDVAALHAAKVDLPSVARDIVNVTLTMVFGHGLFHADPHPGNLFVEPDGRLGLVDFGMVGSLTPDARIQLGKLFIATATADASSVATELLALGTATQPVDTIALTRDFTDILTRLTEAPLGQIRIGPLLQAELTVMRRHRLRLPPQLALLVKTAAMTESLAVQLDPDFMILPAFAPFAQRLLQSADGRDGSSSQPASERTDAGRGAAADRE